jgi:hypothetical protein
MIVRWPDLFGMRPHHLWSWHAITTARLLESGRHRAGESSRLSCNVPCGARCRATKNIAVGSRSVATPLALPPLEEASLEVVHAILADEHRPHKEHPPAHG